MLWLRCVLVACCMFSQSLFSFNFDFDKMMDEIQNLTNAINAIDGDVHNATGIAQQYLVLIQDDWPKLQAHIASIAQLPQSIQTAVAVVNNALPAAEACIYVLGGCILSSTIIFAVVKIVEFCRSKQEYAPLEHVAEN